VYDSDGDAALFGLRLARDRQDARQPGKSVAAERIVDELVGDDAGILFTVADAGKRTLAERPRLAHAEP